VASLHRKINTGSKTMNLVAWLRMDLQENILLTQHDWQFNAEQNPEVKTP